MPNILRNMIYALAAIAVMPFGAISAPKKQSSLWPIVGTSITGKPLSLRSMPGQKALLVFYFAECRACIDELPYLRKFIARHPSVRVLGVTFDSHQKAATFVRERRVRFPVVSEAQKFIDKAGVSTYPRIILLSPNGVVVSSISGAVGTETATGHKVDLLEPWFRSLSLKNQH